MTHQFELFAPSPTGPEELWAVVGDLGRLPEWTSATGVADVPDAPVVGDEFVSLHDGGALRWSVITAERWLLEARADTDCGRLGVGVRVTADPAGSRLVLAGMLRPTVGGVRARLVEVPRLRRRFDEWSARAVRIATRDSGI
jgi:hypothetical protein